MAHDVRRRSNKAAAVVANVELDVVGERIWTLNVVDAMNTLFPLAFNGAVGYALLIVLT